MRQLRAFVFMVWLIFWTAFLGLLATPLLVLPSRFVWIPYGWWISLILWGFRKIIGVEVEVRGLENIPDQPVLIASKHQAMWDTVVMFRYFRQPCVILKKELFYLPFYGWVAARIGMIGIDRGGYATALRSMVRGAKDRIAQGRSIVIFPEGTRVSPGAAPDYKPGVAALYAQLDVPCLPVALSSGLCWPGRGYAFRPGRITLEFLPLIPAGEPRKTFMQDLETRIETATNRLLEQDRTPD